MHILLNCKDFREGAEAEMEIPSNPVHPLSHASSFRKFGRREDQKAAVGFV